MRALGIILGCLIGLGAPASAHGVKCTGLMAWLDMLGKPPYGERLIDGGIGGLPIVHMENEATGTWTLLQVDASGWACLIAEGRKVVTASDPPA